MAFAAEPDADGRSVAIGFTTDDDAIAIEVSGLSRDLLEKLRNRTIDDRQWKAILPVTVHDQLSDRRAKPLLGRYEVASEAILFWPRFPLKPGLTYQVEFRPAEIPGREGRSEPILRQQLALPAQPATPPTRLETVFPTTDRLPENLLKFYLQFSAPMSRGESYRHLRLSRESGEIVDDPFLELGEELWDPDGTRLTVLIDPGRIKRGLKPREQLGAVFEAGGRYRLEVDASWPDAEGRPLANPVTKDFFVGPPDESQPDPRQWKMTVPVAGSTAPLVIELGEPLDRAMLERVIEVTTSAGVPVDGRIVISEEETRWKLVPDRPWQRGPYQISVDTALEDVAGNSIARPFEVDVVQPIERVPAASREALKFNVE